jgi:hypothetical protein
MSKRQLPLFHHLVYSFRETRVGPDPRVQELVGRLFCVDATGHCVGDQGPLSPTLFTSSKHWTYAEQVLSYLAGSVSEVQVLHPASHFDLRALANSS